MRLVKAAEMHSMDQAATLQYGIPGLVLMENAGLSIVDAILERCWEHRPEGKSAVILVGPGNNGGDGLVAARHLFNRGSRVKIFLIAQPELYRGDAAANMQIVKLMGIPWQVFESAQVPVLQMAIHDSDLVIDAVFGTGFRGVPQEPLSTLIRLVNQAGKPVLAVDLPSGLEADSGRVAGECIKAELTVTMGMPKLGLCLNPGAGFCGDLVIGDISFPPELHGEDDGCYYLIDWQMVAGILPGRQKEQHKGSFGHVAVIGGTRGYTGAVCLASGGALRSGAGQVTAVVPESLYPVLAMKLTEAMSRSAEEADGGAGFAAAARTGLQSLLERSTVLAVGPGLGQAPETAIFLKDLLRNTRYPLVLDADALNLLSLDNELLSDPDMMKQRQNWVLTPHPGEMGRLLGGLSTDEVQADRVGLASQASRIWGATVVLKGARTVIATPQGKVMINSTGNPGLATGGTGDVLAGLIAGLLAQGISTVQAAVAGVYIHGLAADRLAASRGMAGLIAGDLLTEIPLILRDFEQRAEIGGNNR
jgi:hydroxyethylthiazole kinase-like uncharacterized protein yjeF